MPPLAVTWDDYDEAAEADAAVALGGTSLNFGVEAQEISNSPDKRLLDAGHDAQMKLEPIKYGWAWQHFLDAQANFWLPTTVPTHEDILQWNGSDLSEREKAVVKGVLGYFATVENAVANNAVWVLHRHVTNPECRMFLTAQANMESIHQWAYTYCIEILGVDKGEAYDAYNAVPEVRDKVFWATDKTKELEDLDFRPDTPEGKTKLLLNLVAFMLCEGIQFYGGFALLLNLGRRNLLPGTCTNIRYIARDENQHCSFAADLVNAILIENPGLGTPDMAAKAIEYCREAVAMEEEFVRSVLGGTGVMGLSVQNIVDYVRWLGCRRLAQLNIALPPDMQGWQNDGRNPLPWLSEMIEMNKEAAFFERRVTDYRKDGLQWGDAGATAAGAGPAPVPAACSIDDPDCEACQ